MSLSGGRSQRCLVSRLLHRLLTSTCLGREKSAITPVDRLPSSVPRAQGGNIARVPFGDSVAVAKVDRPFATQDQPFATACSPPVVVKAPSRGGRPSAAVPMPATVAALPACCARLRALEYFVAAADELHRMLSDGQLDLAVATPPDPADDRFIGVELFRTPLVLVCRRDDPAAIRKTMAPGELSGRDLVGFPTGWGVRTLADRMAHTSGTRLDFNLEVNDVSTMLDLVEAGLGVAFLPAGPVTRRALSRVPLSGPTIDWTISAVTSAPRPSNPAAHESWRLMSRRQRSRSRAGPRPHETAGARQSNRRASGALSKQDVPRDDAGAPHPQRASNQARPGLPHHA